MSDSEISKFQEPECIGSSHNRIRQINKNRDISKLRKINGSKNYVDMNSVASKLKPKNSSTKISQWQINLIKVCNGISNCLKPVLKNLESIGEELTYKVVECKSGHCDNLIGAWLMTIRLTIGKIHFPSGHNDTVANECWQKLSSLAQVTVLALQTHKKIFKPIVRQLEFNHDKFVKYVEMVGRPPEVGLLFEKVPHVQNNCAFEDELSIPNRFILGDSSATVAIIERDIILVHDQDKTAPILHIKESTQNYSPCIEILKIFIEQTNGMISRSHDSMLLAEIEQELVTQFLRNEISELLGLLLKYKQAYRLQERLCSPSLKIAMRSLNDTIQLLIDRVEEIKIIFIWILTAVEAYFSKIRESWPNIDFTAESKHRNRYKSLLQSNQNPWWHLKRIFGFTKFTFWDDIVENVGKFEKCFRQWGIEDMHLINLRVSIPNELAPLLFVENERPDVQYYYNSPGNTSNCELRSFYSDVFIIDAPKSPLPCKGRRHIPMSSINFTSLEDMELDLDEHSNLPILDHRDVFHCEKPGKVSVGCAKSDDTTSHLGSPTSLISNTNNTQNADVIFSSSSSESEILGSDNTDEEPTITDNNTAK